ncbi:hypothetical protein QE152_g10178 [Popillia japonica]|uniref:Uncharacterized protein n=1 Tax=Popillia japonica TaxID=7064 RepID=A0AAW1LWD4_POPJA
MSFLQRIIFTGLHGIVTTMTLNLTSNNIHGLTWDSYDDDTEFNFHALASLITSMGPRKVLVKGLQKKIWIEKIVPNSTYHL